MIMVEKKITIKMEKGILLKENMKKQKPKLSGKVFKEKDEHPK